MRKLIVAAVIVAALPWLGAAAVALPGPDPVTGPFEIQISKPIDITDRKGPEEFMDRLFLLRSEGWDGGDREGYRCSYVEFIDDGIVFEVTFEQLRPEFGGTDWVKINDKNAPDSNDGTKGDPRGDYCGTVDNQFAFDGSDHFPHMIHEGDGLTFYRSGEQIAFLDLTNDQCADSYWVPGDEPGEAWLWWDEDGPTGSHNHEENDLPCGGGPAEPIPVVRAYVNTAQPGVDFCTRSLHELGCTFEAEPTPEPTISPSHSHTPEPTVDPTPSPTQDPTPEPTTPAPSPSGDPDCVVYSGELFSEDGDSITAEVCV